MKICHIIKVNIGRNYPCLGTSKGRPNYWKIPVKIEDKSEKVEIMRKDPKNCKIRYLGT